MPPRKSYRKKAPRKKRAAKPARKPRARREHAMVPHKPIQGAPGSRTQTSFAVSKPTLRLRKGLDALGVPSYHVIASPGDVNFGSGIQATNIVGQYFSVSDIGDLATTLNYVAFAPSTATPMRFCLRSLQAESMFTNASDVQCEVDIYDIVAKRDIPRSDATGSLNVSTPLNAWSQGLINQTSTTSGLPTGFTLGITVPGALPQDAQLFKDYYKVLSKKSVIMLAGATHSHKTHLKIGRHFDLNERQVDALHLAGYANFTHYTMLVVKGQVGSTEIGVDGATLLTAGRIRWVTTERYEYQWLQTNGSVTTYASTLPTPGLSSYAMVNSIIKQDAVAVN